MKELTVSTDKTLVRVSAGNGNAVRNAMYGNKELIKLPSDTTIYAPALNKVTPSKYQQCDTIAQNVDVGSDQISQINTNANETSVNRILQFVEQIRMSDYPVGGKVIRDTGGASGAIATPQTHDSQQPGTSTMFINTQNIEVSPENQEQVRAIAEKMILDAEKY